MSTSSEFSLPPASSLPPKPRMSPMDFQNTELVSRLLAATPPYQYNMALLPNSFFFSEMLRSLVQARSETFNRATIPNPNNVHQQRRSRKRSWNQSVPSPRHLDLSKATTSGAGPKPDFNIDWARASTFAPMDRKYCEAPLELTTKISPTPSTSTKSSDGINLSPTSGGENMFSPNRLTSESATQGLMPPPPAPPIFFPPMYPSPYLDPLQFFMDFRVPPPVPQMYEKKKHQKSETITSSKYESTLVKEPEPPMFNLALYNKENGHVSAFSIPGTNTKNTPMNLSQENKHRTTKFDVKSLGLEKEINKASPNYVMKNIENIYKDVRCEELSRIEEERKQKVNTDLKSLIDLEFVVDYINKKPKHFYLSPPASPTLEVVALNEEPNYRIDIQSQ